MNSWHVSNATPMWRDPLIVRYPVYNVPVAIEKFMDVLERMLNTCVYDVKPVILIHHSLHSTSPRMR
ncbi:MAG: hypothetical protein NTW27_12860 [Deltaproteobacteria bacterium]|nr:hypothetical protein [Deltaproteobacteria bacterium]